MFPLDRTAQPLGTGEVVAWLTAAMACECPVRITYRNHATDALETAVGYPTGFEPRRNPRVVVLCARAPSRWASRTTVRLSAIARLEAADAADARA